VLQHPHVAEGALIATFDDVSGTPRPVKVARPGFRVEGVRPGPTAPPPTLSQHRESLLDELGYDAARRAALIASGAVR
jgi:crotonobetainyl-CoA:carnitine CoA-transferase CaiB-like acyl-CoA transferase